MSLGTYAGMMVMKFTSTSDVASEKACDAESFHISSVYDLGLSFPCTRYFQKTTHRNNLTPGPHVLVC